MQPITIETITASPEPIPVHVIRYKCPYCGRGRSTRRAAVLHMPKCWRNPDLHGCKSCALFQPGVWPGKPKPGGKAPGRCTAGFNLSKGLVTKCSKWRVLLKG